MVLKPPTGCDVADHEHSTLVVIATKVSEKPTDPLDGIRPALTIRVRLAEMHCPILMEFDSRDAVASSIVALTETPIVQNRNAGGAERDPVVIVFAPRMSLEDDAHGHQIKLAGARLRQVMRARAKCFVERSTASRQDDPARGA